MTNALKFQLRIFGRVAALRRLIKWKRMQFYKFLIQKRLALYFQF